MYSGWQQTRQMYILYHNLYIVVGKHDINIYVCYNHALSSSTRCIWNTKHPTVIQFGFIHCYTHLCIMKDTQFPDTHTRCAHCHVFKLRHSYSSSSQIESIDVYMQLHTLSHSKKRTTKCTTFPDAFQTKFLMLHVAIPFLCLLAQ